ncbi:hypothetical protein PVL30_002232 [Lodderomyces elongisporus]|uniref:uncharacterized protein n=1 Tax=Lodderomyces elongisporus TaxID=36914 RepID=UPI00291FAA06|nr:uncharacterized protein PVL30_002232 [Lodderomyces elongisporus]WLF78492.1 hypothetical protein PVL30_002232 [Lodderomyces elongisporus]
MASIAPSRNVGPKPMHRGPSSKKTQSINAKKSGPKVDNPELGIISGNFKLVVRLLPPALSESDFLTQLEGLYPQKENKIVRHYYVKGSYPQKPFELPVYSRAYVSFKNVADMNEFTGLVRDKSFHDEKDSTIPIIEKSLFQKMIDGRQINTSGAIVNKRNKGRDKRKAVPLEDDDIYQRFLQFLNHEIPEFDLIKVKEPAGKKRNKSKATTKVAATATDSPSSSSSSSLDALSKKTRGKKKKTSKIVKKGGVPDSGQSKGNKNVNTKDNVEQQKVKDQKVGKNKNRKKSKTTAKDGVENKKPASSQTAGEKQTESDSLAKQSKNKRRKKKKETQAKSENNETKEKEQKSTESSGTLEPNRSRRRRSRKDRVETKQQQQQQQQSNSHSDDPRPLRRAENAPKKPIKILSSKAEKQSEDI